MIVSRNSLNIIALTLALGAAAVSAPALAAGSEDTALWPERSIPVSQSTRALVVGRDAKAVAIAEHALPRLDGYDRVVALHNICVGYMRLGQTEAAGAACDSALIAAVPAPSASERVRELQGKVEASIAAARRAHEGGTAIARTGR